ncbi:MAG: RluA family pseudouridine synthase [bacterium]|nr:RluA family pseudouridine synthase [bacterium]
MELTVDEKAKRVDKYIEEHSELTRNQIEKLISLKQILVNNKIVKKSYQLKENDIITINIKEEDNHLVATNIPLDIIYEDDDIIVVNKQSGLVVHPAIGHNDDTLVNGLLYYTKLSDINEARPGIVHRIDADTSGLLIIAKNNKVHHILADMIKNRQVTRKYIALVDKVITEDTALIDAPIGRDINNRKKMAVTNINSKPAITHIKVLERYPSSTLIECKLETGRTHQIRVHLNYINHDIINDPLYSKNKPIIKEFGQMLHAYYLEFKHPITNEKLVFTVDPPKQFIDIQNMKKQK